MSTDQQQRHVFNEDGPGASLFAPSASQAKTTLGPTPAQRAGPFYPGEHQFTTGNDLTQIPGGSQRAAGQTVYVKGRVLDQLGRPLEKARVEIWQACASGKYNHPEDPNPASLDPHFRYWAENLTDPEGGYIFKTILPGAYPAEADWLRPPHIHFKISRTGYRELITQMYFNGSPHNQKDLILLEAPVGQRAHLLVDFLPATGEYEAGAWIGIFDVHLQSLSS